LFSLQLFDQIVLGNPEYVDLILSDIFTHRTYSMGTVMRTTVNFYDGMIRGRSGWKEFVKYPARH
jgi:F420-non-reducing hydrogenase large subunit